ncbi:hypothetical protein GCM10009564_46810 [Streptomyces thermogriseus]|uniref:Uncharacterized protein n=1 Tax=Streptomyces thermogriseus TaxID=75292 RepID=A0ABN1T592_9ACTN
MTRALERGWTTAPIWSCSAGAATAGDAPAENRAAAEARSTAAQAPARRKRLEAAVLEGDEDGGYDTGRPRERTDKKGTERRR